LISRFEHVNSRFDICASKADLLHFEIRMKQGMVRFGISLVIVTTSAQVGLFQTWR
jgi:hypothetical protein